MKSGRVRLIALAIPLVAPAWPGSAAATDTPASSVRIGTAADVMGIAEEAYQRGDTAAAEVAFRSLLNDPKREVRAEARFRLAKMIAAAGRQSEAAVLLRRIVDENSDAAPARLELAALLNKMGEQDAALRQLRALQAARLPPNLARFVDRWSASMQATKPFGIYFEVALAPDTNINRATRSDTLGTIFGDFDLSSNSKAKSGLGAAIRSTARASLALSSNFNLVARTVTDASLYRHKEFDDITAEFALGPEVRLGSSRLSAEIGLGRQWYGLKPYQNSVRLSGSVTQPVDSVSQLRIDGGIRWSDNRLNDLQDGHGFSLRARYERALSTQLTIAGSFGIDRFRARDGAYSTRSWVAGISANRDIGRMTVSVGVEIGRLKADERLQILPEARQDSFTRLSLGAIFRQLTVAGFAPVARIVIERNRSTVEFYDFKRTRTEFGISRAL